MLKGNYTIMFWLMTPILVAIYFIFTLMFSFLVIFIQIVLITGFSVVSNIFVSIGSSFIFPKYLKNTFKLIRNDEEAIVFIKQTYIELMNPIIKSDLKKSLFIFFSMVLSLYLIGKSQNSDGHSLGMFTLFIIVIFSFVDLFRKTKNKFGFLDKKRKEFFINFIYEIYSKYSDHAKEIYYSFLQQNKTASFVKNFEINNNSDIFDKFIIGGMKTTLKMGEIEASHIGDKYSRYIEKNIFPESKKESLDMIYNVLIKDFNLGINLIKKAKIENIL